MHTSFAASGHSARLSPWALLPAARPRRWHADGTFRRETAADRARDRRLHADDSEEVEDEARVEPGEDADTDVVGDDDDGQDFDEDEVEDDTENPTVSDIYFSLPEAERLSFLQQQVRELEAVDEPGEDVDEDVDEGQDFDEDEDYDFDVDDGLSDYIASLPEEEQLDELKRIVREQAATIASLAHSQEEDEDVDEDEDAGEGDDEDYDDAADHHNLSTPPDADADPNTDDADAEDEYVDDDDDRVRTGGRALSRAAPSLPARNQRYKRKKVSA